MPHRSTSQTDNSNDLTENSSNHLSESSDSNSDENASISSEWIVVNEETNTSGLSNDPNAIEESTTLEGPNVAIDVEQFDQDESESSSVYTFVRQRDMVNVPMFGVVSESTDDSGSPSTTSLNFADYIMTFDSILDLLLALPDSDIFSGHMLNQDDEGIFPQVDDEASGFELVELFENNSGEYYSSSSSSSDLSFDEFNTRLTNDQVENYLSGGNVSQQYLDLPPTPSDQNAHLSVASTSIHDSSLTDVAAGSGDSSISHQNTQNVTTQQHNEEVSDLPTSLHVPGRIYDPENPRDGDVMDHNSDSGGTTILFRENNVIYNSNTNRDSSNWADQNHLTPSTNRTSVALSPAGTSTPDIEHLNHSTVNSHRNANYTNPINADVPGDPSIHGSFIFQSFRRTSGIRQGNIQQSSVNFRNNNNSLINTETSNITVQPFYPRQVRANRGPGGTFLEFSRTPNMSSLRISSTNHADRRNIGPNRRVRAARVYNRSGDSTENFDANQTVQLTIRSDVDGIIQIYHPLAASHLDALLSHFSGVVRRKCHCNGQDVQRIIFFDSCGNILDSTMLVGEIAYQGMADVFADVQVVGDGTGVVEDVEGDDNIGGTGGYTICR